MTLCSQQLLFGSALILQAGLKLLFSAYRLFAAVPTVVTTFVPPSIAAYSLRDVTKHK